MYHENSNLKTMEPEGFETIRARREMVTRTKVFLKTLSNKTFNSNQFSINLIRESSHSTKKVFNLETTAQKDNSRVQINKQFAKKKYTKQPELNSKIPDKNFTIKQFQTNN